MKIAILAITGLVTLYTSPVCAGKLPYFNNQHVSSPVGIVTHHKQWTSHSSHSSFGHTVYSKGGNYYKWQKGPIYGKFSPYQHATVPSSFEIETKTYDHPSSIKHSLPATSSVSAEPNNVLLELPQHKTSTQVDDYPLSVLINQLEEKLQRVKHRLAKDGQLLQTITNPQDGKTEQTATKSGGKLTQAATDEPYWIKLDMVNGRGEKESLVKSIQVLLERLNEPASTEDSRSDVRDLIDIRSNFHNK